MATAKKETIIEVPQIEKQVLTLHVLGKTPFLCNRMSEKAQRELLLPARRKNQAERQASLKHDPLAEFRASAYCLPDGAPTLLAVMSAAFKGAMTTAALDLPGTAKAQIGRLVYVLGDYTPVWGTPKLHMSIVRTLGMNRTPDVRTRAILPRWACRLEVEFVKPILQVPSIVNLLSAGGITAGVGDGRPEKGKLNFGQFVVVNADDPGFRSVLQEGRAAQIAGMEAAEPYDLESADLLSWWTEEIQRRGFDVSIPDGEEEEDEDNG